MTTKATLITAKRFVVGLHFLLWFLSRVIAGSCGLFKATFPSNLRRRFEKLGATYVKFGQVLAMRPDITPRRFGVELEALLDAVPPVSFEIARRIVETEFNAPLLELFSEFEQQPVGSASFAQVHSARLEDGTKVAVKIQRPDLRTIVRADLRFLRLIVFIIDAASIFNRIKLTEVYREFCTWTLQEIDFEQEAAFIERFRMADMPTANYPRVFWNLTSPRVLTMSFFEGRWLTDVLKAIEAGNNVFVRGLDRKRLAADLFENALFQFFDLGLFNADPHAGNICVLNRGLIGYVDFGIVGQIGSSFRQVQMDVLDSLQREDLDDYYDALFRLLTPPAEDVDLKGFELAIKANARNWLNSQYRPLRSASESGAALHERSSATLFSRNFLCARRFGVSFSDLSARYYRAAAVLELIVFRLDPDFMFRDGIRRYFSHYRNRQLSARLSPREFFGAAFSWASAISDIPYSSSLIQDVLSATRTEIRTAVSGFQKFASHLVRTVGWLLLVGTPILFWFEPALRGLGPRILSLKAIYPVVGLILLLVSRHLRIRSVQPGRRLRSTQFSR